MRSLLPLLALTLLAAPSPNQAETMTDAELIRQIIRTTAPLFQPRGARRPLYLWPAHNLGTDDEAEIEDLLRQLEARGIAAIASWRPGDPQALAAALRQQRSRLQRQMLAEPVLARFPDALVGNYAVYPHDGYRYWFDYFEKFVDGAPHRVDGRARYRKWYPEFPETGYTFAMPVVYTWQDIYGWYDFDDPDYRWFYNMLKVGSNAGQSTPAAVPLITFVHWHTVILSDPPPPHQQFSEENYRELLWHLLLRGHDALFMWSPKNEALKESQLVHQVYAASHPYSDFLLHGEPVTFAVPAAPGPVVSALRRGNQLLVRRTDFDDTREPVELQVDSRTIRVPRADGQC